MNEKGVVLIPCFNPDVPIMEKFLKELKEVFENIVIVNDGSENKYLEFFERLKENYIVVGYENNLGKGKAIKIGIQYVLDNFLDSKVIITADCDGQHSVKDIEKCFHKSICEPNSLILGSRNFEDEKVPIKSKFGNKMTRKVLDMFVGAKLNDTQTGLRSFSFDLAENLKLVKGDRYEYETNVLIYCQKNNIKFEEVLIETIYIDNNRTSHFNPLRDSYLIYRLFFSYIIYFLISYIIGLIVFNKLISDNLLNIIIAVVVSTLVCNLLIYLKKRSISIKKISISSFVLIVILFSLVKIFSVNLLVAKIIIDILYFLGGLLLSLNMKS